ncbi:MAG: alanine racemase [Actinobacteria bacterium]|nr:alanine racemase [Actinomycetota bacterium]
MTRAHTRPAWVEVDLQAIRANAAALAAWSEPAQLCAVVKADGYGHGAEAVAAAALEGGASWLAVALVEEGLALREAGISAEILVLADAPRAAVPDAIAAGLSLTVSSSAGVDAIAEAGVRDVPLHLKVDTGMHRMGCDPSDAPRLAKAAVSAGLRLEAVWTHLAVADDPAQVEVTNAQIDRLEEVLTALRGDGLSPVMVHLANSAGAIHHPPARRDLVRCGISLYGYAPSAEEGVPAGLTLEPALSLKAEVTAVREVAAGDGVSYGWVRRHPGPTRVATIPLGYADGVPRSLGETGGEVLIRGTRRPLAGRVTMDQLMVACDDEVDVGDEVVLIGRQGDERITADDWGTLAGTISYEILSRLGPRVPRRYF